MLTKLKILFLTLYLINVFATLKGSNKDSVYYEILLSKSVLKSFNKDINFITELEITPKKYALIASTNQLYLLSWGHLVEAGRIPWGNISSYAYTYDSLLFVVRNNELCSFDSTGTLNKLYKLPNSGMGISCGEKVVYLYDRNSVNNKFAIYILTHGGKYVKLLEQEKPISNLIELDNSLIFSSEDFIYKYDLKNKEIKTIIAFKNKKHSIKSIAANIKEKRIYFSTDSAIYAISDTTKDVITNKLSGKLKYFDNGLVVFDAKNQFMVRIVNIEEALYSNKTKHNNTKPQTQTLTITPSTLVTTATTKSLEPVTPSLTPTVAPVTTQTVTPVTKPTPTISINSQTNSATPQKEIIINASIIKMSKAKLSDELIIDVIKTSEVNFDLKVESMVNLSNNGVSSAVIREMKAAMEKKNNK